jgi:hypothetical protein
MTHSGTIDGFCDDFGCTGALDFVQEVKGKGRKNRWEFVGTRRGAMAVE